MAPRARGQALWALAIAPLLVLLTGAFGIPAILAGLVDWRGRWSRQVTRSWARALLACCRVRVEVDGVSHVPAGPAVYAANHGSVLDILMLFGHMPVEFRILHKRSLYYIPVVGLYLWLSRHVGIDRSRAFRARRSLHAAAERIRAGVSVAAFPEGTRSRDGSVGPFKRGTFLLAIDAGVPVVPVSLAGVKAVAPRGLRTLRPGTVRLRLNPAIPTAGLQPEDAEGLARAVREQVVAGCEAAS